MCTSNSLIERANRLRNDIDNVMTQIHSAETVWNESGSLPYSPAKAPSSQKQTTLLTK